MLHAILDSDINSWFLKIFLKVFHRMFEDVKENANYVLFFKSIFIHNILVNLNYLRERGTFSLSHSSLRDRSLPICQLQRAD